MSEDSFIGWSLEDWSLRRELLELRFNLWPNIRTEAELEAYNDANKNRYDRGKGIFVRPKRMTFSNFTARARVEQITVSRRDDIIIYRLSLEKGAFVEIEARAYTSVLW